MCSRPSGTFVFTSWKVAITTSVAFKLLLSDKMVMYIFYKKYSKVFNFTSTKLLQYVHQFCSFYVHSIDKGAVNRMCNTIVFSIH